MSDREGRFAACCFALGFGLSALFMMYISTPNHKWQKQAIDHGAAQYSPVTGKFEWKEKDVRPD